MAELNWGLLRQPDIAGDAMKGYASGQKQGQERIGQNAMMALAQDPKNTQAMAALSAVAPDQALAVQSNTRAVGADARAATTAAQTATRENYLLAAKLTRNIKTPEEWEAAKHSPDLAALVPDVATKTWEDFQVFHQTIGGLEPAKKYEAANLGGGGFGSFDPETGALKELRPRDPAPAKGDWKERTKADGSTEFVWLGPPGSKPPGAGEPQPSSAEGAPAAAGVHQPRGLRNNNPLNIRPLAHSQWDGQTGVDEGNYAQFGSEQDGWNAAHKNLAAYGKNHGINTVAGVINRWAPGSDGNDPGAYAATVAKALGVAPDAHIDLSDAATREKLLTAMSGVELGRPYAGPGAGHAPAGAPVVAAPASGAPTVPGSAPKPKPTYRPATPEDISKFPGLDPKGTYQVGPDGQIHPIGPSGDMTPRQLAQTQIGLRQQFNGEADVKAYNDVAASFEQVKRLFKTNGTPADDMAGTYSFMKMLDPGSVVREGEFAMVAKTAGLPDQIVMALGRLDKGKALTPAIRQRLVEAAQTVYQGRQTRYGQLVSQYQEDAKTMGLPENTIRPRIPAGQGSPNTPPKAPPPQRGQVVKGYRYNGGDPSKPSSWGKVAGQ